MFLIKTREFLLSASQENLKGVLLHSDLQFSVAFRPRIAALEHPWERPKRRKNKGRETGT